jgi:hypothetical protein
MNIVIPEILSGGKGRDMQRSSRMIGDALAGIAQAGAKIYNQAGRIEAKQADNDLNVELSKLYGEAAEKTDGTNPKLADEVKTKADQIYNKYDGKISNSTAKELLKYSYESRISAYTEGLNKHVADRLWQTTVEGVKIKVADSVRIAGQTGDLIGGADAIKQDLESQREYFGGRFDMVSRTAMSLYYSNAIPVSLSNPQTRGATLAQLDNPHYKEKYYKHLDAEQIRAIEYHYGRAKREEQDDQVYSDLYARFSLGSGKANYAGAIREIRNPKKYNNLDMEQRRELENMLKAQQGYDEHVRNEYRTKQRDVALDKVYALANEGHITHALDFIQNSDSFTEAEKFKLKTSLASSTQTQQTDIHTYLEGVDIVYDINTPAMEKKKWILSNSNRLSMSDQKALYSIAISDEKKVTTAAVKDGISILKNSMTIPGMSGPTSDSRLKKAIALYETGLKEHADKLKTPEEKRDYAYQILKIPEFTNINPVADMKTDMQRMRGVGMPTTAPPKATAPPKTFADLPAAAEFTGKILRDTATGKRFKSNGADWLEVK